LSDAAVDNVPVLPAVETGGLFKNTIKLKLPNKTAQEKSASEVVGEDKSQDKRCAAMLDHNNLPQMTDPAPSDDPVAVASKRKANLLDYYARLPGAAPAVVVHPLPAKAPIQLNVKKPGRPKLALHQTVGYKRALASMQTTPIVIDLGSDTEPMTQATGETIVVDSGEPPIKKYKKSSEVVKLMARSAFHKWAKDGTVQEWFTQEKKDYANGKGLRIKPDINAFTLEQELAAKSTTKKQVHVYPEHEPANGRPRVFTDAMLEQLKTEVIVFEHSPGFGVKTVVACASDLHKRKFSEDPGWEQWIPSANWARWFLHSVMGYVIRTATSSTSTMELTEKQKRLWD